MPVITELHGLAKDAGSVGDSARSALIAINKVISERKDLKIITAKNSDLTKIGFFREKLDRGVDDDEMNIDDIIIRTAKNVAESRRKMTVDKNKVAPHGAEPAVLLTEDVAMRVKANASGVPAISTTVLKKYLLQQGKSKAQPRQKRKSAAPLPSKKEDGTDLIHEFGANEVADAKVKQRQGKRRAFNKRGKTDAMAYSVVK